MLLTLPQLQENSSQEKNALLIGASPCNASDVALPAPFQSSPQAAVVVRVKQRWGSQAALRIARPLLELPGARRQVDLYENGTIAIVEAVSPELGNRVQRVRVQLPGTSQELLQRFRDKSVDFAAHSNTEDGGAVFLNLLGAHLSPRVQIRLPRVHALRVHSVNWNLFWTCSLSAFPTWRPHQFWANY